MNDEIQFEGCYVLRCVEPDGRVVWRELLDNGITTEGLNYALGVVLADAAKLSSWYIGIIGVTGFSQLSSGDTMASHAGWTESIAYQGGARKQYAPLAVAGALVINTTGVSFVFTADTFIKGIFLVSNSTLGGSTGTLFSTAALAADRSILAGQTLNVTYRLRAGGAG